MAGIKSKFRFEFVATLLGTFSGAILITLLARLLEPGGYGLLQLTLSIIGIVTLFSKLGISRSTARYITEYRKKDPKQLKNIILYSSKIKLSLTIFVALSMFVGNKYIAELIGESEIGPLLLIGAVVLVGRTLLAFIRKIFQGFDEVKWAAKLSIIRSIGNIILVLGLVLASYGVFGALLGYAISALVASIIGTSIAYSRIYNKLDGGTPIESGLRRRIAEYSIPLTFSQAAGKVSGYIDTVLIGFYIGPIAVGPYVISKQIITFLQSPTNAISFALAPSLAAKKGAGNSDKAARIFEETYIYTMILFIPASIGVITLSEPIIKTVFGADYHRAIPVLRVFGLYAIIQANIIISSKILDFLGRARTRAIGKGITSILNLILNILLIPVYGIVGAAIATVFTSLLYSLINFYALYSEIGIDIQFMLKKTIPIAIISVVMGILVFFQLPYISGLFTLLLVAVDGLIVYTTICISVGILDKKEILDLVT